MANENEPKPPAGGEPSHPRSGGFPWTTVIILLLAAAIIAGVVMFRRGSGAATSEKKGPATKGGSFPVAAVLGTVNQKDFPIYADGLGTAQAFNMVTVRSRVDGQLQKVTFEEGQDVRAGALLAQIDPAPFQTQVAQAEAKKSQDEAQVQN